MILWRLLDTSRDRIRISSATADFAVRAAWIAGAGGFVWAVASAEYRITFYPWLLFFPLAASLLYDISWIWGAGALAGAIGVIAAAGEGLFARDTAACGSALVFAIAAPWISGVFADRVRRVEDESVMGRVAFRKAEEYLLSLSRVTIPALTKEIDQLEMRGKKYERLNRLLLDVPEKGGLAGVAAFYAREAENLIGRGRGECYVAGDEDSASVIAASDGLTAPAHTENDAQADARYSELIIRSRPELSANGDEITAPVMSDGRPVGILRLAAGQGALVEPDLRILDGLSVLAAVSIMNAVLYQRMDRLARVDGLTGLAKRQVFDSALEEEIRRAERYGGTLSIIMMDIDHFRVFNNSYGHVTGDWVIREFSTHIREAMPHHAVCARWGGEEFIALIPGDRAPQAAERADEIRSSIAERMRIPAHVAPAAGAERITFSAGVAQFPDHARDPKSLIALADEALYAAKRGGRNRVVIHGA